MMEIPLRLSAKLSKPQISSEKTIVRTEMAVGYCPMAVPGYPSCSDHAPYLGRAEDPTTHSQMGRGLDVQKRICVSLILCQVSAEARLKSWTENGKVKIWKKFGHSPLNGQRLLPKWAAVTWRVETLQRRRTLHKRWEMKFIGLWPVALNVFDPRKRLVW